MEGDTGMAPYALDWSREEAIVASGGYDKNVLIWNVEHNLAKEKRLIIGGETRELKKAKRIPEYMKLQGHEGNVEAVVFNPASANDLCSVSVDKQIIIWDLRSGKSVCKFADIHKNDINCVDWSSFDTNYICTGSTDQSIALIDIRKVLYFIIFNREITQQQESHVTMGRLIMFNFPLLIKI